MVSKLNSLIFYKFFQKTEEDSFCGVIIPWYQIQTKTSPENYKAVSYTYGHKNSQQNTKKWI